jgi:tetratricopeptide (TPR) repeat protein
MMPRIPFASVLVLLLAAAPAGAQHGEHASHGAASGAEGAPLYESLGTFGRPIGTSSELAQRYFDQGMRLTFGFAHGDAVRSFREAARLDPNCAICWWGVAWASGPHINDARRDSASLAQAFDAIQDARRLRRGANPVEQALIDAMAARYARVPTQRNRSRLDSAYARAMGQVVRRHPDDLDAATLYGESLMVLSAWNYWMVDGEPQPGTAAMLGVLESVLARDLGHPGACHLYVHAVEASRDPGRAVPCAELLEDAIPGVSHIPHMPAHVLVRVGRYGDAVRGNQRARMADLEAREGRAVAVYPTHNLHMLLFAASYDGQSAVAMQAARDLALESANSAFFQYLVLARFGRWSELVRMSQAPEAAYPLGLWRYARGLALLRTGEADSARTYREALAAQLDTTPATATFRGHPHRSLLGMAHAILAAEIAAAAGEHDEAVGVLRAALPLEDGLRYDEPEPWLVPLRQVLGMVLLEAGRPGEAEAIFREELQRHPENGWSLHGLEQSLRAQGRGGEADAVKQRVERAWARADVRLRGARY